MKRKDNASKSSSALKQVKEFYEVYVENNDHLVTTDLTEYVTEMIKRNGSCN